MSRRRYISTKLSLDARVNKLATTAGDFAALLYTWMIPHAEDDGRLTGDPEELLMLVLPGRRDRSVEDVAAALDTMHELGLIHWERSGHEPYVEFPAEAFYAYQTYIPENKRRAANSGGEPLTEQATPQNAADQRKTPLARDARVPSPSPSPSLSPSLSPSPSPSPSAADVRARATPPAAAGTSGESGGGSEALAPPASQRPEQRPDPRRDPQFGHFCRDVARRARLPDSTEFDALTDVLAPYHTRDPAWVLGEAAALADWIGDSNAGNPKTKPKRASLRLLHNWLRQAEQRQQAQAQHAALAATSATRPLEGGSRERGEAAGTTRRGLTEAEYAAAVEHNLALRRDLAGLVRPQARGAPAG